MGPVKNSSGALEKTLNYLPLRLIINFRKKGQNPEY